MRQNFLALVIKEKRISNKLGAENVPDLRDSESSVMEGGSWTQCAQDRVFEELGFFSCLNAKAALLTERSGVYGPLVLSRKSPETLTKNCRIQEKNICPVEQPAPPALSLSPGLAPLCF